MTLHERLLRLVLGHQKAAAVLGDLEEEAQLAGKPPSWIVGEAVRCATAAAGAALYRRTTRMFSTTRLALRDARRAIWRFRATSALAVLILTISMTAGAVTYAVVDGIVLRPLPYPDSHRLASLFGATPAEPRSLQVSPVEYYAWREQTTSFESMAAYRPWVFQLPPDQGGTPVSMIITTASLFDVLRARPLLGELFTEAHEVDGAEAVAVIGHGLWQRRFGGDPAAIGSTISTPTGPVRVIGVMPREFTFPVEATAPAEIWRPLVVPLENRTLSTGRASYLEVIGRLRGEVTIEEARADVARVSSALAATAPLLYANWQPRTELAIDAMTERVAGWMRLVLAAVAVLLVIGCANVSNLLLARSAHRARDISVRASLGATRAQLVAGLLAESFLLAGAAVGCGLLAAHWLLELVRSTLPAGIPRADLIALDRRVLAASALACVVSALLSGLVPAFQASRTSLAAMMREGASATASRSRRLWQHAFLVTQVALVTLLLATSTLLVGSFVRVLGVDVGFAHPQLLGVRLNPNIPAGPERDIRVRDLYIRVEDALRGVSGVSGVATLTGAQLPLYRGGMTTRVSVRGSTVTDVPADLRNVSDRYFETAGIRLLQGREFSAADRHQNAVVIDELAARHFFGSANPLGRTINLPNRIELRVIGVVSNVRTLGPEGATQPQIYRSIDGEPPARVLMIRASVPPSEIAPAIKATVDGVMPQGSARFTVDVVEEQYRLLTADRRFNAWMMTALGVVAFVVGVGGVYATAGTMVAQRRKEIAIRMALGATATRVVRSMTAASARLLVLGALLGALASWIAADVFRSIVFGIEPTDLLVYLVPVTLVAVAGGLAALVPARRAARIDPLVTLRTE
jgi:putative ABC transport system permease protein